MSPTGAWSFQICVYWCLLSHLSIFNIYTILHSLSTPMTKSSLPPSQNLMNQIGLSGTRRPGHFFCLQALTELLMPRKSQLGWRLLASDWTAKDCKMYVYLFFLIEPNYHTPIIVIKSSWEAWAKLVAEYEKDSAMMCMALHQQFYSLTHDPTIGIVVFIDTIFWLFNNSVLLVINQMTWKLPTSF